MSYYNIIPTELIREQLSMLPVEDIVKFRRISKEWKTIIDSLWFVLIKRDFPYQYYVKDDYQEDYKRLYKYRNMPFIVIQSIKDTVNNTDVSELKTCLKMLVIPNPRNYSKYLSRHLDKEDPDIIQFMLNILKTMNFKRYRNIYYYDPKNIFLAEGLMYLLKRTNVHFESINLQNGDCYQFEFITGGAWDIQKELLNKIIPKVLIHREEILRITYPNIKIVYEKVYKDFDKEFLIRAREYIDYNTNTDAKYGRKYNGTENDLLELFYQKL